MRKNILIFIFVFFIYFTSFLTISQAQEQKGQNWVCLQWEHYNGPIKPGGKEDHRLRLKGNEIPTNKDVYIVAMIGTKGYRFTTGNDTYDKELGFGDNNYTFLSNSESSKIDEILPYIFIVDGGSKRRFTDGKIDVVVASDSNKATDHRFFAVWDIDQLINDTAGTIKYGTATFKEDITRCTEIHWDPLGRVFDAQSLEPLPQVELEILDYQTGLRVPIPKNPKTTGEDGMYNFLVEKGSYKLKINKMPLGYKMVSDAAKINPNYLKAYAGMTEKCENLTGEDGNKKTICSKLYLPDEEVKENPPIISQRDIALDPGVNLPYRASKVTSFHFGSIRGGKETLFEGRVSHPLTKVKLVKEKSREELGKTQADKFGFWKIMIPNEKLPLTEDIVATFEKVDLTKLITKRDGNSLISRILEILSKKSAAQENNLNETVKFTPIFPYIEGYAYDNAGKIIPNAIVVVRLKGTTGVYYQTKADEKGYFQINQEFLPPFEYQLEFKNPLSNQTISNQSTSQFAEKNKEYLLANKIDLVMAKKDGREIFPTTKTGTESSLIVSPTKKTTPKSQITENSSQPIKNSPTEPIVNNAQQKTNLILLTLFIMLIILSGVLVFFFFKKKSDQVNSIQ